MNATLSILGLYRIKPDIFDGLLAVLPKDPDTQDPLLNETALTNNILLECAELEILYPDPDMMELAITTWALTRSDAWARIYTALTEEYNPLHNYDRHEEIDKTYNEGKTLAGAENSTRFSSGSDSNISTLENPGYNSGTLVTAGKTTDSGASSVSASDGKTSSGSESTQGGEIYNNHLYGNIGVTTSAQMLSGELEVRRNDMYNIITNEFRRRFCLLVY